MDPPRLRQLSTFLCRSTNGILSVFFSNGHDSSARDGERGTPAMGQGLRMGRRAAAALHACKSESFEYFGTVVLSSQALSIHCEAIPGRVGGQIALQPSFETRSGPMV